MPKLAFCRVWETYPHGLSVQRWACNGCGQLTRTAFECQDGACKECGQLTHTGPLSAKIGV